MAKDENKTQQQAGGAANTQPAQTKGAPAQAKAAADDPPEGWTQVGADRLMYKPELCKDHSVRGVLLARLTLPDGPNDEPWNAYVIRCTHATVGVDREGNLHEVKAGEEILLPETYRLAELQRAAEHPELVCEVWIKPHHQQPLGGGKKMWIFKILVNPKMRPRRDDEKLFGGAKQAPQLGAGNGGAPAAGASIGQSEADPPF